MRDENTSARLCAKKAGWGGGAYLRDTTVIAVQMKSSNPL